MENTERDAKGCKISQNAHHIFTMIWLPKIKLINIINIVMTCDDIHENTFMTLLNYKYKKRKFTEFSAWSVKNVCMKVLFIYTNTKTA